MSKLAEAVREISLKYGIKGTDKTKLKVVEKLLDEHKLLRNNVTKVSDYVEKQIVVLKDMVKDEETRAEIIGEETFEEWLVYELEYIYSIILQASNNETVKTIDSED